MEYGHFSPDSREYIITRPDTPTPWINYLSNQVGYCGIVSQTGGGFSFHRDPRDRRLTKYRYNNIPVLPGNGSLPAVSRKEDTKKRKPGKVSPADRERRREGLSEVLAPS